MSEPPAWNPYWHPHGARVIRGCPEVGQLVPLRHAVWQVMEVRPLSESHWTDDERRRASTGRAPMALRLRPVELLNHPDPVKARSQDLHVGSMRMREWRVYDDEHYPVCRDCGEPTPCRATLARREGEKAIRNMGRYEQPGVCPACQEPVTARQKARTFTDNLEVLGGPPVTFHLRGKCRGDAMLYEQRWVAAAPEGRRLTMSCTGHITNHNDGTYDCTEPERCPGPTVTHPSYGMCGCPPCRSRPWTWGRGCHPDPNATLNRRNAA